MNYKNSTNHTNSTNNHIGDLNASIPKTLERIVSSKGEYRKFLDFSIGVFKYSFDNSLLIYDQKPTAKAVGEYSDWGKVDRGVKRGVTPIWIPNPNRTPANPNQYLRLYDLSETYPKIMGKAFDNLERSYTIPKEAKVSLIASFGVELANENNLENFDFNFKYCIEQRVEAFYNSIVGNISDDDLTQTQIEAINSKGFEILVKESAGYTACQRFGIS